MYRKVDISDIRQWLEEFENRPPRIPNVLHPEELELVLGQLAVTDQFPDMRRGQFWCVYAQTHPGKMKNSFDVLVHMFATGSEPSPDCQGLRVALQNEDGIYWLTQSLVDHHGQVWFKNVSPGCYHVVPDHVQLHARLQGTVSTRAAAASRLEEDLLIFYPEDRRIRVDLMRLSKTGKTELTVSTQMEELTNKRVQFVFGDISGTLVLKPTGVKAFSRGTCELELAFSDASRYVPRFSITTSENENE
ncbi:MAG: hypothetical protein ACYSWO_03690 [Planctomycetota bacterium]|jgi:hypothetical protein